MEKENIKKSTYEKYENFKKVMQEPSPLFKMSKNEQDEFNQALDKYIETGKKKENFNYFKSALEKIQPYTAEKLIKFDKEMREDIKKYNPLILENYEKTIGTTIHEILDDIANNMILVPVKKQSFWQKLLIIFDNK